MDLIQGLCGSLSMAIANDTKVPSQDSGQTLSMATGQGPCCDLAKSQLSKRPDCSQTQSKVGTGGQGTQGEPPGEHRQASPPNHRRLWCNPGPHTYTHTGSSARLEVRPILRRTCPGWPRPRNRMESFSPLDNETKIICCFNHPHDSQHNGQGHGVVKTNAKGAALGRSTASPHARGKALEINQHEQINLTQSPTLEESVQIGPPVPLSPSSAVHPASLSLPYSQSSCIKAQRCRHGEKEACSGHECPVITQGQPISLK